MDHSGAADVELRLPAERVYAAVVRTTAAGLAARLDFTIDDIEDLRIAIGEATTLVLEAASPGADLTCRFRFGLGAPILAVELETATADDQPVDLESFAWQVLDTMTEEASAQNRDERFLVRFLVESDASPQIPGAPH